METPQVASRATCLPVPVGGGVVLLSNVMLLSLASPSTIHTCAVRGALSPLLSMCIVLTI